MIKHIIFDFDGTIVDSKELTLRILNEMAQKYHFKKVTMEEVYILRNVPVKERFKKIGLPLYKIPVMAKECTDMFKEQIHSLKTYGGIRELLLYLKEDGFCLSVLSSNSVDNITDFLKGNDLMVFDHIISAHNLFGKHKSLLRYMKKYRVTAEEILYVGDEHRDIEACQKTGVKMAAVTWGFDPLSLLQRGGPDYIADRPEDIITAVKSMREEMASVPMS